MTGHIQIKEGNIIPNHDFMISTQEGLIKYNLGEAIKKKNIIIFGLPGAFTPTCSTIHAPSYVKLANDLKNKGVDRIYCLSVNDPFVMKAWAKTINANDDTLQCLPDWNASFSKKIGMIDDLSSVGLGIRSKRYSMIITDKEVKRIIVDDDPTTDNFAHSDAEKCLAYMDSMQKEQNNA